MPAYSQNFGETLEKLIKLKGFTKKVIAEKIGYTAGGFNHFVKGRVPDGLLLKKIADILDVTMEELLTGEAPNSAIETPEVRKLLAILDRGEPEDTAYLRGVIDTMYRKLEEKVKTVKRGA